jgi:hypothetical protein
MITDAAQSEEHLGRAEKMGNAWRIREDALWNPFEVAAFVFMIIFAFGFLLGGSQYLFVAELFFPVIVIGVAVVVFQTGLRWRIGDFGLFSRLRDLGR